MQELHTVPFDLQYFADGGAGGEGAGEGAPAAEAAQPKRAKYSGVQNFAKKEAAPTAPAAIQEQAAPVDKEPEAAQVDPDAEFEALTKKGDGKYFEAFQRRVDAIVNKRFGEVKTLQEQQKALTDKHAALAPALSILGARLGVDPNDPAALQKAIENDEAYLAHEAEKRGMTPEEFRQQDQKDRAQAAAQAELERFRQEAEQRAEQERRLQKVQAWRTQEPEAKKDYPWFNIDEACSEKPGMLFDLHAGIPLKDAIQRNYTDKILGGAMQYTAQRTREQVAKDIAARGNRPPENGATGQPAQIQGFEFEKLSKSAKADIERRAGRGEEITPKVLMEYMR